MSRYRSEGVKKLANCCKTQNARFDYQELTKANCSCFQLFHTFSVTAGRTGFGVRPSSGAASTECCGASDFIGSQRVPTLLRPRTGALRDRCGPPSLRRCEKIENSNNSLS